MKTPAQILASAFENDPLPAYLEPDPAKRMTKFEWLMGASVRWCRLSGVVDVVPGQGVAGWLAPYRHVPGPLTMLWSGLASAPLRLGPTSAMRLAAVESDLEKLPESTRPKNAWYLLVLGVDPSAKGQGLSRELVEKGFERADSAGVPVRLETNNEANVAFYEHLGFEMVGHRDTPGLIPQWSFLRPARTA